MSILETFYILFKSDASDVKKGAEEAEKSTKKLDESLKNVNQGATKVGQSFVELARAAATFLGVATAAHAVLNGITEANNYALQLGDASRALGVNAEELDLWGNVVKRTGGSVEGFQQSLKGLAEHLGTSANVALKALPQLAGVFERLGRFRALQYGKMLGLDESTILLLQQGRREVEAVIQRQKELGTVTQASIENSQKYRIAQNELGTAFRSLYLELGQTVIPILTRFYNFLVPIVEYIKRHKDLVIGAFIGIGIAAAIMLAPFIAANAAVIAIAAGIAAFIALVAIAYEDIQAFLHGHNSLIGDILKRWPLVGTVVGAVVDSWKQKIHALIAAFKFFQNLIGKISDYFKGDSKVTLDIQNGQNLIGTAGASAIGAQTSNSIFNSQAFDRNSSINTGPITINTQATDAVGISKGLGKGIQEHLWQANNEFANGVSY